MVLPTRLRRWSAAVLGAHLFGEARQFAWRIICWGLGLGAGFGLAYLVALEPIAALFTPHREVVQQVGALYVLIALLQPLNAVVFVFDGIFIGASDMGYLFKAMALATFGVFFPAAFGFYILVGLGIGRCLDGL